MVNTRTVREPLFQVSKRGDIPLWQAIVIRAGAIVGGLLLTSCIFGLVAGVSPFAVLGEMFNGALGNKNRIWILLRETSLLLLVGLALVPAFKMKFWNLGGNGQILIGALATAMVMRSQLAVDNPGLANIIMVLAAVLAGAIWAVIPAIFKAFFKTNESLFTLMMNYIAVELVSFFVYKWVWPETSLGNIPTGHLPTIIKGSNEVTMSFLTILCAVVFTVAMYFYIKNSKHGYEVSVVGESEKTAKYAGMNVKKVLIRTLVLSGAICGIVGMLLVGSVKFTLNSTIDGNMGFTAIMATWLGKFNPFIMIGTSFLIVFMSKGMSFASEFFDLNNNSIANVLVAVMYFIIIACEFFILYKVKINKHRKTDKTDFMAGGKEFADTQKKEDK